MNSNIDLMLLIREESGRLIQEELPRGLESDLVRMFVESFECGIMEDRIPLTSNDSIVREMSFRYGRADIVVFHSDGSASVIEAKDGSKGYSHVVSGIGQAAMYATQLAMTKGAITRVRKCLMWTSAGSVEVDAVIESACISAGVVPLPWPSMGELMASLQASRNVLERVL